LTPSSFSSPPPSSSFSSSSYSFSSSSSSSHWHCGYVARPAATRTALSIGDVVSPSLCDHEVCTLVVFGAGG
jgi:hypothetical protein